MALDDPIAAARFAVEEVEFWRDAGIYYFVPCVFEDRAIAVLALGRKGADQPFNSEDLALLTAVAGQAATAIENGRLYRQLHLKAEELDGLREFNENILESLDDGLVVFDAAERIVRWNRALEGFYGVARSDGDRADARRRVRGDVRRGAARGSSGEPGRLDPVPRAAGRAARRTRRGCSSTRRRCRCRGGEDVPASAGTILLIENITDRVRLVEQLQLSEKMASIGVLAAGVAHEVNTPLTGISSFTQMLLENADPADPRTALLEKIERQTFRAAKIVNGLLNLSRPGPSGTERSTVDLNAVITDVFSLLEHQFSASKIKIRRELSPSPVAVLGIEHQLQQVFLNLFLNARDAMPRGGWLSVATRIDGDRVARGSRRHRVGHSVRASGAHLRSVLHDQGDRPRHRPRPVDHLRHRPRARRDDRLRQRGRPGHALHAEAADRVSDRAILARRDVDVPRRQSSMVRLQPDATAGPSAGC